MIQLRSGRATTTDVAENGIAHASSTIQTQQSSFGSGFAAESHFESGCKKFSKASGPRVKQSPQYHASVVLPGRAQ
jgi:hypothetical protein